MRREEVLDLRCPTGRHGSITLDTDPPSCSVCGKVAVIDKKALANQAGAGYNPATAQVWWASELEGGPKQEPMGRHGCLPNECDLGCRSSEPEDRTVP